VLSCCVCFVLLLLLLLQVLPLVRPLLAALLLGQQIAHVVSIHAAVQWQQFAARMAAVAALRLLSTYAASSRLGDRNEDNVNGSSSNRVSSAAGAMRAITAVGIEQILMSVHAAGRP
jgi:hypothetical protein